MKNCVENYVDNFEYQEGYRTLLNSLIGDIQNEIEESIKNGDLYKKITYDIDANNYDEETIDQIIEDIDVVEDFKVEGYKVDIHFNDDYTVDYYISVDTDVNEGHLDKFEQEEEYDNLLYSVIPTIQNEIEMSIKNGDWYKTITYEIEELKPYDDETIDNIIEDIFNYGGEDFENRGFELDMQFDGYVMTYKIEVETYVGYLDYNLIEHLFNKHLLNDLEDIERYVKAFNKDNTVIRKGWWYIVNNVDEDEKASFYYDGDHVRWEHYVERIED